MLAQQGPFVIPLGPGFSGLKFLNFLPILKLQGILSEGIVMRIDLNPGVQQTTDPAELSKSSSRPSVDAAASGMAADVATLSPDYLRAQKLVATVNQLPELRKDRVETLSAALRNGTYSVTSEQTADALLTYMTGSRG
jgi:flagellar biosynthesis anti-sigma factor FlgM